MRKLNESPVFWHAFPSLIMHPEWPRPTSRIADEKRWERRNGLSSLCSLYRGKLGKCVWSFTSWFAKWLTRSRHNCQCQRRMQVWKIEILEINNQQSTWKKDRDDWNITKKKSVKKRRKNDEKTVSRVLNYDWILCSNSELANWRPLPPPSWSLSPPLHWSLPSIWKSGTRGPPVHQLWIRI